MKIFQLVSLLAVFIGCSRVERPPAAEEETGLAPARPNILFIFSDDHATNAISAYGSRLAKVAPTPNIDRLAAEGALFANSFCCNSICGPSRAAIQTGKHSHINGFMRNRVASTEGFDTSQWMVSKALQEGGYHTALIGKWHLQSTPVGFDHYEILPGQGAYYNPTYVQMDGTKKRFQGFVTDLTTDKAINWLSQRDKGRPFFLMCQYKAPHRTFCPPLRHLGAFNGVTIPEPDTLFDDYANRTPLLKANEMEIDRHMHWDYDLKLREEQKQGAQLPPPPKKFGNPEYSRMNPEQRKKWDAHFGPLNEAFIADFKSGKLTDEEVVRWKYQRYMKNYLGSVKGIDDNVGRLLDFLEESGLKENTIVIYSSDQGFFLGEHGWYDKRWMFEESLQMPFIIRWPGQVQAGSRPLQLIQNIDYAPTFLDMAGLPIPEDIQGESIVPVLKGNTGDWRNAIYYAYYEVGEHNVPQHFGVRTPTHKLFYMPATDEWQMFDLVNDPQEMVNLAEDPDYREVRNSLEKEYHRLRDLYEAPSYAEHATAPVKFDPDAVPERKD
jgi:arylsulfatase A-like enzyme